MSAADGGFGPTIAAPPGESRLPTRIIAIGLLAGLVVGGLVGALLGSAQARSYQATTIASILPDDALTTAAQLTGAASTEDSSDVIQGELVVITSQGVRSTVQHALQLTALPDVSASQSGTTDIVDITATAATPALARQVADTTRTVYAQQRAQELDSDVAVATSQVENQITAVRRQITATPGAATDPNGALEQEYARLLAVDSELALDSAQSSRAVSTIQTAVVSGGGLSDTATYGLGGAVIGVLLAAVGLVAFRRVRPRVYGPADLAALGAVLTPALPVGGPRSVRTARILAGGMRGGADRTAVVLVGTDGGSGAPDAAAALAVAFGDAGPVLLLSRPGAAPAATLPPGTPAVGSEGLLGRRATTARLAELPAEGVTAVCADAGELAAMLSQDLFETAAAVGWTVVADAPPLGESRLALRYAERTGSATVLVARGGADPGDVAATVAALRGAGIGRVELLLHEKQPLRTRGRREPAGPAPVAAARRPTPGVPPSPSAPPEAVAPRRPAPTAAPVVPGMPDETPAPNPVHPDDAIGNVRPMRPKRPAADKPTALAENRSLRGRST